MIALITYILLTDYIYDAFAPLDSVMWAIFYFSNHYIAFGLIALRAIKHSNSVWIYYCVSLAFGFFTKAIIELTKLGMTSDEYYESVNNLSSNIIFSAVVISLISLFYARKKTNNR